MQFQDRSCEHFSDHKVGSVLPSVSPVQKGDTLAGGREGKLSLYSYTPALAQQM